MKFSLEKLRDDPDFIKLFEKKATDIKKNKHDLVEAARTYQTKYSSEIEAGTKKRQLLLAEGRANGIGEGLPSELAEAKIFENNSIFIPTRNTPILNYLFFLLRETKFEDVDMKVLRNFGDTNKDIQLLREEYETKYGAQTHPEHENKLPEVVSFIYAGIDDGDTFSMIKKLKTISESGDDQEAAAAFKKGRELCKKFKLEWAKIPVNN